MLAVAIDDDTSRTPRLWGDFTEPVPHPDEVVVDVAYAAICGSDRLIVNAAGKLPGHYPRYPIVLGHEGSGVITAVGSDVHGHRIGDRVAFESHIFCGECGACSGGDRHVCDRLDILGLERDGVFAEHVAVPARTLVTLPPTVDFLSGALLEPFGVAVNAVEAAGRELRGRTVLISGCGPVGAFLVQVAKAEGANVVVLEVDPLRRSAAEKLGATALYPYDQAEVAAVVGAGGAAVAFDTSGHEPTWLAVAEMVQVGGAFVSLAFTDVAKFPGALLLNRRQLSITGVWGRRVWSTWARALDLVSAGQVDLSVVVGEVITLGEVPARLTAPPAPGVLKTAIHVGSMV